MISTVKWLQVRNKGIGLEFDLLDRWPFQFHLHAMEESSQLFAAN